MDLSVLSDLVDLDLLGVGQGVVQGLRRGLWYLTRGWRRAHHALCGETDGAQYRPGRQARRAHLCLPSLPRPQTPSEERKFFIPRPKSTCPSGEHSILQNSLVLSDRQQSFQTCREKESKE